MVLTGLCFMCLAASFAGLHPAVPYLAIAFGSVLPTRAAWESLRAKQLDVNVLMLLAAIGSLALGMPVEAAVLMFLFSLSGTLEAFALGRTKSAIEALIKLRPDKARLVEPDGDREVLVSSLKAGDQIRVLPFEQIPADGVLKEGSTSANEAAMTGEARPSFKQAGDMLLAGTQNLDGSVVMEVRAAQGDTALDKVVALVREAQDNKASGERISAWFGTRYTFAVIAVFLAFLVGRLAFGQDLTRALYASLTVFVALSPCALVIASPAASLSALAWAARNGILARGGEAIEAASQCRVLALDKTGTLTRGKFTVERICVHDPDHGGRECWHGQEAMPAEAREVLGVAAALEVHSTHPIAAAIVATAEAEGLDLAEFADARVHPGLGISGTLDGVEVKVGQTNFFGALPPEFEASLQDMREAGMTTVILEKGDRLAALGLRDAPRPEARQVLDRMKALGFTRIVMITGDTAQPAGRVAAELGITEVHAGLMPADKEALAARLNEEGGLLYVGDGVNDAPSLARAKLGVAMGGLGSDIAMNAAQAVLMKDSLEALPRLAALSRKTNAIVKGSLLFAAGVVAVLFFGSILADSLLSEELRRAVLPVAVMGHEGSTVLVILNGLRLLRGPAQQS